MGRHEVPASVATFDQAVSDYVTQRARELVRAWDEMLRQPVAIAEEFDLNSWCGAAAEILRELTRDA